MTNEERDIITRFVERIGGGTPRIGGSVPGAAPALPPVDREADGLIADLFTRNPEARYRITQTAFVQEVALAEAQSRLKRMEAELEQARQSQPAAPSPWQTQPQPMQPQPAPSRGLFGSLFGGAAPQPQPQYAPQPQPQYAPQPQFGQPAYPSGYQPGMFQRSGGSGFLGSALTTAAGVAGGVVVGNALMDMFSGHGGGFGGEHGASGAPAQETINNYYGGQGDQGALPAADPWAGAGSADPGYSQGSGSDPFSQSAPDTSSGWDSSDSGTDDSGSF